MPAPPHRVWRDFSKDLGVQTPLNNTFYRMQVNLRSSLCITAVFLYCYGHRKKRNFAQSLRKYADLTLRFKIFFWGGGTAPPQTPPSVRRGTPTPHSPWGLRRLDSARAVFARPCPPTLTPGSAYDREKFPSYAIAKKLRIIYKKLQSLDPLEDFRHPDPHASNLEYSPQSLKYAKMR